MIPAGLASTVAIATNIIGGITVDLPATTQSAYDNATTPDGIDVGWRFNRSGTVDKKAGSWLSSHAWGTPTGGNGGDDYAIRAILNSGTTPSGITMGVWYGLTSSRSFTLFRSLVGTVSCSVTVSIRDNATLTIQDTQTYTLNGTVDNDY